MNPEPSKLRHQEIEQQTAELHQTQQKQTGREFASVEELIRQDAQNTPVPPVVAERLVESMAREPKPPRSWWRRIFGSA